MPTEREWISIPAVKQVWPTGVRDADFVASVENWIEAHENDPIYQLEERRHEARANEVRYWRAMADKHRGTFLGFLCEMRYWRVVIRGWF